MRAGVAVVELEVHRIGFVRRAEHVHLAFAAAFEGDGVEVALGGGLDVEGHQLQRWAVVGRGFHLRLAEYTGGVGGAAEPHRRSDETLHHVTLGWAHIALVHVDARSAQAFFYVHGLAVLAGIQAQDRTMMEIAQLQRAQFDITLALEQPIQGLAMGFGDEHHRGLHGETDKPRALVGGQPETDLRARRGIAPMPGQDKTLL
ncbi:hypothetical protein ALQ17_200041 [Pseudomonas fluorescens]|nr:hypothetical protein ALQ17_200041 [Pseudomonas fluorescens]